MENQQKWLDGTPIVKARHILTISNDTLVNPNSLEDVGNVAGVDDYEAYHIYDLLTHKLCTPEEVINEYLSKYGIEGDGVEDETIARGTWYWGVSGCYFLTQDQFTGVFDIWEGSCYPYFQNKQNNN